MGYCNKKFSPLNKIKKSLVTKQKIKNHKKEVLDYEYKKHNKHNKPGSKKQ